MPSMDSQSINPNMDSIDQITALEISPKSQAAMLVSIGCQIFSNEIMKVIWRYVIDSVPAQTITFTCDLKGKWDPERITWTSPASHKLLPCLNTSRLSRNLALQRWNLAFHRAESKHQPNAFIGVFFDAERDTIYFQQPRVLGLLSFVRSPDYKIDVKSITRVQIDASELEEEYEDGSLIGVDLTQLLCRWLPNLKTVEVKLHHATIDDILTETTMYAYAVDPYIQDAFRAIYEKQKRVLYEVMHFAGVFEELVEQYAIGSRSIEYTVADQKQTLMLEKYLDKLVQVRNAQELQFQQYQLHVLQVHGVQVPDSDNRMGPHAILPVMRNLDRTKTITYSTS
jgi:hypothetical protein